MALDCIGGDHKAVRSGTNNSEHNAKMAALTAIDDLKKIDAEKTSNLPEAG